VQEDQFNIYVYGRSIVSDDSITHWIFEKCRSIAPELLNKEGEFNVLSVQIGRRPSREAGPRLELEWLEVASGERKFVCHNYGHSHSG
jgi:D-amino-acid oxidase